MRDVDLGKLDTEVKVLKYLVRLILWAVKIYMDQNRLNHEPPEP